MGVLVAITAVVAAIVLPVMFVAWLSAHLAPRNQFRAGLGLGLVGLLTLVTPSLYASLADRAVDGHPVIAPRPIPLRVWSNGPQSIEIFVSVPKGVDLACALGSPTRPKGECYGPRHADIDWVVREGRSIVARGNPMIDRKEEIDPARWAEAQRRGARFEAMRVEKGLPPRPQRLPPLGMSAVIGHFPALAGHRYTLELTPHFDSRVATRVTVGPGPVRGKGFLLFAILGWVCGAVWLAGGSLIAWCGRQAMRERQ
jgi:hypothetical protein